MHKFVLTAGAFALGALLTQPALSQDAQEGPAAGNESSAQGDDAFLYQDQAAPGDATQPDAGGPSEGASPLDRPLPAPPDGQAPSPAATEGQGLRPLPPPGGEGQPRGDLQDRQLDQPRDLDAQRDPMLGDRPDADRRQDSQQFERRDEQFDRGFDDRGARRFDRGGDDWRFVQHQGRWWYWTPNRTWLYHDGGDWQAHRGHAETRGYRGEQSRYGVGYRGDSQAVGYVDPCACPGGPVVHHSGYRGGYSEGHYMDDRGYGGGYQGDYGGNQGGYESRRPYSEADRGGLYEERSMTRGEAYSEREGQFDGREQATERRSMGLQDRPAPPRDSQMLDQQGQRGQQGMESEQRFRSSGQQSFQQQGSMEMRGGDQSGAAASGSASGETAAPTDGQGQQGQNPGREGTGADNTPPSNPGTLDMPRDQ